MEKFKPKPSIKPKSPNIISGTAVSENGKILVGALVIIKDENGRTVRSLKTNELGHFRTTNPLPNGMYAVEIHESEKNVFVKQVELKGEIVSPIEFIAHGKDAKYLPLLFSTPREKKST